jgi:hypothetical protein
MDPLEWFPFGSAATLSSSTTPDLGLGAMGSSGGGYFQDRRFLPPLVDRQTPVAKGFFLVRSLSDGS